ncbi:unnamed protein product [Rotaria sordida]|uniref:Uncharacterized protein n=1 Tax=Rotaria sordida TaxID=392033 RepID=A0A814MVF5_9BILA|nr:unnamed protein product [Rotaria sordida]
MAPEQLLNTLDVQSKNEMNLEEEESDDEESSKSSTTKHDKSRKITHSEIERRRREKMNRYIDEIAQLLPMDAVKKLDKLTVLRVAVDTIKHLKGTTSEVSSGGFGKQIYLNDNELLELILATIDQLGTYFFLIIECQQGRICYASCSTETMLGYKSNELCLKSIFDVICPDDIEIVKQQLMCEKKTSLNTYESSSTDSKTHLHKCNEIVVVSRGEIVDHGPYDELMNKSKILRDLVYAIVTEGNERRASDADARTPPTSPIEISENIFKTIGDKAQNETIKSATVEIPLNELKEKKDKLIQKETVETGSVKLNVFLTYIHACTMPMVLLIFILFSLTTLTSLSTNIWLSRWTDRSKNETISTNDTSSSSSMSKIHGLTVYSILGFCQE